MFGAQLGRLIRMIGHLGCEFKVYGFLFWVFVCVVLALFWSFLLCYTPDSSRFLAFSFFRGFHSGVVGTGWLLFFVRFIVVVLLR